MAATDGKSLDDAAKWRFGHDESRTAQAEIAGLNRNCRNRAGTAVNPPDSAHSRAETDLGEMLAVPGRQVSGHMPRAGSPRLLPAEETHGRTEAGRGWTGRRQPIRIERSICRKRQIRKRLS